MSRFMHINFRDGQPEQPAEEVKEAKVEEAPVEEPADKESILSKVRRFFVGE